jgi:hypothetical protein
MKLKYLFLYFLFLTSCIKPIPLEIDVSEPKIVMNALITEGRSIQLYIGTTSSFLDTNEIEIAPQIELFEENNRVAALEKDPEGFYTTFYPLSSLKQYKIEVRDADYGICTAIDTIPEKVPVTEAEFYFTELDEYETPYFEAQINFDDPPNKQNYYEILIYDEKYNEYVNEYITSNASIINEGDQEYMPTSLFFSDELFNGNNFEIKVKFVTSADRNDSNEIVPQGNNLIILRSISYTYYRYRKYWTRHAYNQTVADDILGMFFKGEPIDAYTNVSNGYGIFAGYNEDVIELTFINK